MTGQIRLFNKINGLLSEVPPDEAETRREGRRVSRLSLEIDVLWTPEEEAARDTEETLAELQKRDQAAAAVAAQARKAAAIDKLQQKGISLADLMDALS